MSLPPWQRILVRLPNWVGDVVMATPALAAIRQRFPDAEITAAVKTYAAPLLEGSPLVDRLLPLAEHEERGLRAVSFARRLRSHRFDAAVLLTNSFTTALPPFLARIPRRIGYAGDGRSVLLTDAARPVLADGRRRPMPMPAFYQRVLDVAGIPSVGERYVLPVAAGQRAEIQGRLEQLGWSGTRPIAALNGGAKFGASKMWKPERFAAVARHLRDAQGFQILVLCGPGEQPLCQAIVAAAGEPILDTSADPIPLRLLPALMERVDLMITTDSGPRHIAVAAGKPVVVIMGPTHPDWTACNLERSIVVRQDVDCGPCHLKVCPTDHRCMDLVTVSEVLAAAARLCPR